MNRALRAATIGVLLLSPVALSACSAGQVAQTATQNRDKTGGAENVGNISLRDARLAYPTNGQYAQGADARLILTVANGGETDDVITEISGEDFEGVEIVDPEATPAADGSAPTEIPVPANTNVYIGQGGPTVTLTGLTQSLTPAQSIPLTVTFAEAGEVTLPVLVGTPSLDLPRGDAFDFHTEGGIGGADAEEPEGTDTSDSGETAQEQSGVEGSN